MMVSMYMYIDWGLKKIHTLEFHLKHKIPVQSIKKKHISRLQNTEN